jgi:hypothetical protein
MLDSNLPTNTKDCNSADRKTSIAFTREADDVRIGYRLNGTSIEQKEGTRGWVRVTADDVRIDSFKFTVVGTDDAVNDGDSVQPRVSLYVDGKVNNGLETDTDFSLQTTITGRILDY